MKQFQLQFEAVRNTVTRRVERELTSESADLFRQHALRTDLSRRELAALFGITLIEAKWLIKKHKLNIKFVSTEDPDLEPLPNPDPEVWKPCPGRAGSIIKIREMARRINLRLPLFHPDDNPELCVPRIEADR